MSTAIHYVNEKETRTLAWVVFGSCVLFFITHSIVIFWILLIEFVLRALTNTVYSPVRLLDNIALSVLKIQPLIIPEAPKKLAAAFGLIFCICIITLHYLGYNAVANVLVGLMAFFSLLEASIDFWMATKIYNAVMRKK